MIKRLPIYLFLSIMALTKISAQGENPTLQYDVPAQNLLKFNRFLINPTFSTVREDKSYVNLLHRNQSVSFDDNNQDYFLSYSGRIGDRSGVGLSLFTQTEGIVRNYGALANYAYGIKLSDKSNFTFGANFAYYKTGINRDRISTLDPNDPALNDLNEGTLISFQPGFNLSYGKFDFGLFAENLFDYNIGESISNTQFDGKTFSGHLQYTHQFENGEGILQQGRLMPLARVRMVGQEDVVLGGSLLLDLPKLGWIQAGYDDFYGAAAGIGFHLSKRISLGYTMEKGLSGTFDNFGLTHEISFAYSFSPNLTEDRVLLEADRDELVDLQEEQEKLEEGEMAEDSEVERLKKALAENNAILEELMFRQDSLEANRQADLERRFDMVMRMVQKETGGNRPDVEEKARKIYFQKNNEGAPSAQKDGNASNIPSGAKKSVQKDALSQVSGGRKISSKKFRDLKGVDNGYYVIANVYRDEGYLGKFVSELREKGIAADYFTNERNGLKYVYLNRYDTWKEAVAAYNSNLNGSYSGDVWIMDVDNPTNPRAEGEYVSNTGKAQDNVDRYGQDVLKKNVLDSSGKTTAPAPIRETFSANGVDAGYYIIANVFSNANNANRFVKLLNSKGLSASYFVNPKNNYRYVYLKKHSSWNNALISYYTKLNRSYDQQMWIMRVVPTNLS